MMGNDSKEESCKCGESCKCRDDGHQQYSDDKCDCAKKFLKIADEAWMELLKDKIKIEIESKKGSDMNKLAEIIAKANGKKWKHKITAKMGCEEYKDNLKDFFTSDK